MLAAFHRAIIGERPDRSGNLAVEIRCDFKVADRCSVRTHAAGEETSDPYIPVAEDVA